MTEGRSTGIPKILQAMKQNGSPSPEFDFDEDHTFFMCRLPVHPGAKQVKVTAKDKTPAEVTAEVGTKSGPSRDQVEIMRKCLYDSAISELMALAGRTNRTKFRDQVLNPLLSANIISMTIPDKPNSRLQKYRLTDKGRAWLASAKP